LNVLTNILTKPFTAMFSEFQGTPAKPDDVQGSGDVKYHMGTSSDRDFGGTTVHMSLVPNPSHLEFVDPVVVGKARAKQSLRKDPDRQQVLAILIHGDAALSGQGIVAEIVIDVRNCPAIASVAPCISSLTTRSASPPRRSIRARAAIGTGRRQDRAGADFPRQR